MFEFITSPFIKLYDQSTEYFTRNWCTAYSLFWILSDMYWLRFTNKEIIKFLEKAELQKKWYQSQWAYFSVIYKFFVDEIYKKTGIRMYVKKVYIDTEEFYTMCQQGYSFGLWLKHWNKEYIKAIEDGNLTKEEIKVITSQDVTYLHNHRYYQFHIIENYKYKFGDNTIDLPIKTLREAVNTWMYYLPARTLVPENTPMNKLIVKWLQEFKLGSHKTESYFTIMLWKLKWDDRKALKRAYKLYLLHK